MNSDINAAQGIAIIELRDVTVDLTGQMVLKDISIRLQSGDWLGLVGPNGAGKSTLLRVVSGLITPSAGEVVIDGEPIQMLTPRDLARRISLVPQRVSDLPGVTVRDFLELSSEVHDTRLIEQAASRLRIHDLFERLLPTLSGGELQRVMVAGAVAQGASVLLLDEPTNNLDPTGCRDLESCVAALSRDQSLAGMVVTHDLSLVSRCCREVLVLAEGAISWRGSPRDNQFMLEAERAYSCRFRRIADRETGNEWILPVPL